MKRRKWDGSWDGGRFRDTMDGPSYWIEKMVGGRRYAHPLGNVNEARAKAEYALFLQSPLTYVPPAKRIALDAHAKSESEAKAKAGAVVITTDLIEACVKAARAGTYGRPKSEKHIKEIFRYLGEWALGPLAGRDLRHVSLAELNLGLDRWPTARRKRIVVLKSFTKFLRQRGQLTSQNDPTRDLVCPQPAPPSEAAKAKKVYTPGQLAEFYRHLDRDDVRDVFLVRALTGLHFTEIERIAKGEGVIRPIGKGEIAATVSVKHKSGVTHVQSLDKRTHKALERIVKRGRVPDPRAFIEAGRRAVKAMGHVDKQGQPLEEKRIRIEHLRHTFVTLASRIGRLVQPEGTGGIPDSIVSQLVGHHDVKTTRTFYLAVDVPPLIVLPLDFR